MANEHLDLLLIVANSFCYRGTQHTKISRVKRQKTCHNKGLSGKGYCLGCTKSKYLCYFIRQCIYFRSNKLKHWIFWLRAVLLSSLVRRGSPSFLAAPISFPSRDGLSWERGTANLFFFFFFIIFIARRIQVTLHCITVRKITYNHNSHYLTTSLTLHYLHKGTT